MKKYFKLFMVYFLFITLLFGLYYFVNQLYIIGLDSSSQYIPFLNNFKSVFRTDNSFFYNWQLGLGDNYFPHFAYYIGSWISTLFALITPNILLGYNFLILIKITLIAVSMFAYLSYHYSNKNRNFLLALCYALCSYVVVYAEFHNWLDIIGYLPLLALASDHWLKTRKNGYYISIVSALMFLSNYIFSIYAFIFIAFYMLYRYFYEQNPISLKDLLVKIISYLLYCLLGFALVAWLLIPVAHAMLFNSAKTTDIQLLDSLWTTHFDFDQIWVSLFNSGSGYVFNLKESKHALLYCGLFPIVLMPFALIKKERKRTILNVAFLLFCLSPYLFEGMNILFNFMYTPIQFPFRYSFVSIFGFILLSAGVNEDQITPKKIILWLSIMLTSFIIYFRLCGYFNQITTLNLSDNKITVLINVMVLVAMAMALVKKKEGLLVLIICLDLASNAYYSNLSLHQNTNFHFYKSTISKYHYQSYPELDISKAMIYSDYNKSNAALFNQQQGSIIFSSSLAKSNFEIASTLNINQAAPALIGFAGRTPLYDLFGVEFLSYRYNTLLVDPDFKLVNQYEDTSIYQNQQYYQKGFITDQYILQKEFEQLPLYLKDVVMLDCAILKEAEPMLKHIDIKYYESMFEEKMVELKDYVFEEDLIYYLEKTNKQDLNIIAQKKDQLYHYKDQFFFASHVKQSYVNQSIYYLGNLVGQVGLSEQSNPIVGTHKLITMKKQAYLDLVASHANDFDNVTIHNNQITYSLNSQSRQNELLVTTIPFDLGWQGAEFRSSHGGLLAFAINSPTHSLKFIPYGFKAGIAITIASIGLLTILMIRGKYNAHKNQ